MLTPGYYDSPTVLSHSVIASTKKGTPGVSIVFSIDPCDGGAPVTRTATFWLSGGAAERSVEALGYLGLEPGTSLADLNDGTVRLNGAGVSLTVEHETYTTDDGTVKTVDRIQWVNKLGGGAKLGGTVLDASQIQAMGLDGIVAAAFARQGARMATPAAPPQAAPQAAPAPAFAAAPVSAPVQQQPPQQPPQQATPF